ncbi:hypothetical protein Gotur_022902 [Gossypium turneri]
MLKESLGAPKMNCGRKRGNS